MPDAEKGTPRLGDRVRLWIGPPKRGGFRHGEVIGIDNLGNPGVQIRFDRPVHGEETCYATHAEVEVVARAARPESCHCGQPVAYGYDGDPTHHRGMCEHCDAVRCDAYPGTCVLPPGEGRA